MKGSASSSSFVNALPSLNNLLRDSITFHGRHGHLSSWKQLLKLTHGLGLTLLGAGTLGALLLLRQITHSPAFSWILGAHDTSAGDSPPSLDPHQLFVPGLRNVGNNCFLNSILQALASSQAFLSFLATFNNEKGIESCPAMPLTEALMALLEELSMLDSERHVANPCNVIFALEPYVKHFDLALQQDAGEALSHLSNALQEERLAVFQNLRAYTGSLLDVVRSISEVEPSALNSWREYFNWPMEGSMGSSLTCKDCGFQFSTRFECFHDVVLSPPHLPDGNIVEECTIEECLHHFTAPECISNVRCSRCSHLYAIHNLQSRKMVNKALVQKIEACTFDDDCLCEGEVKQEGIIWRNIHVNALKQLKIGRCPEVLCFHVRRAIMNASGELIKWMGHVSFPFVLNLFPFTVSGQGNMTESIDSGVGAQAIQKLLWHRASFELQGRFRNNFHRAPSSMDESTSDEAHLSLSSSSEDSASESSCESTSQKVGDDAGSLEMFPEGGSKIGLEQNLSWQGADSPTTDILIRELYDCHKLRNHLFRSASSFSDQTSFVQTSVPMNDGRKFSTNFMTSPNGHDGLHRDTNKLVDAFHNSEKWMYELISVVVHHGSPRNGHYTVYRKANLRIDDMTHYDTECDSYNAVTCSKESGTADIQLAELSGQVTEPCLSVNNGDVQSVEEFAKAEAVSEVCWEAVAENGVNINNCMEERSSNSSSLLESDAANGGPTEFSPRMSGGLQNGVKINNCMEEHSSNSSSLLESDAANGDPTEFSPHMSGGLQKEQTKALWFRVSDSQVDLVTEEEVLMAQASLLFYERRASWISQNFDSGEHH